MINKIYQEVEKLKNKKDFIDLTDSNFARPEFFKPVYKIISPSIQKLLKSREYKPDALGDINARQSISKYYLRRNININPEEIIITASTSEAYNILFQTFSKIGDTGLIPNPGYPLFEYLFKLNKIDSYFYFLEFNNNWRIDFKKLLESITNETKFLILISPNNPTGSIIPQSDINKVISICQQNKIFLIIDEVFISFSNNLYSLPPKEKIKFPIFILNGISKMFGLPDFKLGWIAVYNSESEEYVDLLETTNDVYLSATTLTQNLLPLLFDNINLIQKPLIKRLNRNRKLVNIFFKTHRNIFKFNFSEGGIHVFFGINKLKGHFNEEYFVLRLLNIKHILIYPCYFYDYKDADHLWFSFSYIIPTIKLKNSLETLL